MRTNEDTIFTSEAGLAGHPDKIADQIGDAVLDAYLSQDPYSRVGCNVMVVRDFVLIGGQITSNAHYRPNSLRRWYVEYFTTLLY